VTNKGLARLNRDKNRNIAKTLSHESEVFLHCMFPAVVYSWFSELRDSGPDDACSCQGRWRFKLLRKFGLLPLRTSASSD